MRRESEQAFPAQWQKLCIEIGLLRLFYIIKLHILRHRKEDFEIQTV